VALHSGGFWAWLVIFEAPQQKFQFLEPFFRQFISDLQHTGLLEMVAVLAGIASVWFSRKENILVYPVGLVNTIIYVYLSIRGSLLGEASVNLYYTVMSIYGWALWARRDRKSHDHLLKIQWSDTRQWMGQLLFFSFFYCLIFLSLSFLKQGLFAPGAIPWADAFASATAYTGMWLMARKKVESWYWWIATNLASVPLYAVKHFAFTSVYYLILLAMAVSGLLEWKKRAIQKA
jgi:nicotinamide mononucleotide transporter